MATPVPSAGPVLKLRTAQRRFVSLVETYRLLAFVARRQFGKTTTFSGVALKKMMRTRNHTVIFGSAKLNLSREIVRKEAAIMQRAIAEQTASMREQFKLVDAAKGTLPANIGADDFAEIFEAQRMEFRYFHDRGSYSRTKVVALRPDTVGETGDLMADEIGRIANWREVWEAIEPIVSSDPTFRLLLSTTPPPDDSHYSFEQLSPPIGTEFEVNPAGNLYKSEAGLTVLRVDAYDAHADGVPVYDLNTGEPLPPAEHRRRAADRDAWDRNYGCKFVMGGTAACGYIVLENAQRRGFEKCRFFVIEDQKDLEQAALFLRENLGPGNVGLGWDLATTEKGTSNPSAFVVAEEVGRDVLFRAVCVWKTADPDIAKDYAWKLVFACSARASGGLPRRLSVDASNERYFAADLRKEFLGTVPVELVIASETVEVPGAEPMTRKQFMGGRMVSLLEDNRALLPPDRYIREDFRLVKRDRGTLNNDLSPDGKHGDTFDAAKLALHSLTTRAGTTWAAAANVGQGADQGAASS